MTESEPSKSSNRKFRISDEAVGCVIAIVLTLGAIWLGLEYVDNAKTAYDASAACRRETQTQGGAKLGRGVVIAKSVYGRVLGKATVSALTLRPVDIASDWAVTAVCDFDRAGKHVTKIQLIDGDRLDHFVETSQSLLDPRLLFVGHEADSSVGDPRQAALPIGRFSGAQLIGTVRNGALPNSPAPLRMSFDIVADTGGICGGSGLVEIAPPLAGGGRMTYEVHDSTLSIQSTSPTGDVIRWIGVVHQTGAAGIYFIKEGPFRGQDGRWEVQTSRAPLWPTRPCVRLLRPGQQP